MRQLPPEIKTAIIDELPYGYMVRDPFCGIALVWPEVAFASAASITPKFAHPNDSFLKLAEFAPPIALAVSSIVVGQDDRYTAKIWDERDSDAYEDLDSLKKLFAMLGNVSTVRLIIPKRKMPIEEALQCLPLTGITDVDFVFPRNEGVWTEENVLHMLLLFPNIERLGLDTSLLREGEEVQGNDLFRCDTLRSITLTDNGRMLHHIVDCMAFSFVSSLTLLSCDLTPTLVDTMEHVAREWDNLRELNLQYLTLHGLDEPDGTTFLRLPITLDTLNFDLDLQDRALVGFVMHTLERHISAGSSLRSMSFCPDIEGPWSGTLKDPSVRRLDEILGSEELGVRHLEWCQDGREQFEWLQTVFVCTKARFMTEEGRKKYGTTFDGPT